MKHLFLSALFVFSLLPIAYAQNSNYANASNILETDRNSGSNSFTILNIPGGGKFEGMGGAHTAMALDGSYLEANPAAGSFLPRTVINFSHINWIADSGLETLNFTFRPQKLENMALGFSGKFLHVPFTAYNDLGDQYANNRQSASGWYTEFVTTAAISYNLFRNFYFGGLSVGGSLKVGYRGISNSIQTGQNAASIMGDFGILTQFDFLKPYTGRDWNFSIGMALKNVGAEFIDDPDPLPTYASFGIAYKPLRLLTIALDVNFPFNLDGSPADSLNFATGVNVDVTQFLSAHMGFLIKSGKPRFAVGADVNINNFTVQVNYNLDLASRPDAFDRISVSVKLNLDEVEQRVVRDDVQNLYLTGMEYYAKGEIDQSISYFSDALSIDKTFTPAREMMDTALMSKNIENELQEILVN